MRIATIDLETYWSTDHSLSKMNPILYCMHPDTELISCAIKINNYPTDVFFGEATIRKALHNLDWSDTMAVGHNMSGFDSMILAWRLGLKPKMWGCTLAMARPIHALDVGNSLAKLVTHYGLGEKNAAVLHSTKGKHLKDFSIDELEAMKVYNRADVDQCYALFNKLLPHHSQKELWHIDASIRMLIRPKFIVDRPMLEVALSMERDQKLKHLLDLARLLGVSSFKEDGKEHTVEQVAEEVREQLASAPKFAALLERLGVPIPMKASPTVQGATIPALAKSDEEFIALTESDDAVVAAAANARLAIKSTQLETRIQTFLDVSQVLAGRVPMPLNYCGAAVTGRDSGGFSMNVQNLPAVRPGTKPAAQALRKCMRAPAGHKIVVSDLSGIELRVNMFLWKVPYATKLFTDDPEHADLYKSLAADVFNVPYAEVSSNQRKAAKAQHLGCGYGLGSPSKFRSVAKTMAQIDITEEEAQGYIAAYREKHPEVVNGWRTCGRRLEDAANGLEVAIDPWGLCWTQEDAVRLPSGRLIRYTNLRQEPDGEWPDGRPRTSWVYGTGRNRATLAGPKCDENIVQALARDILKDNKLEIFKRTGLRSVLDVHDELVYIVPEGAAEEHLELVQQVMRTPPVWWPQLAVWSEGGIADRYGDAK